MGAICLSQHSGGSQIPSVLLFHGSNPGRHALWKGALAPEPPHWPRRLTL